MLLIRNSLAGLVTLYGSPSTPASSTLPRRRRLRDGRPGVDRIDRHSLEFLLDVMRDPAAVASVPTALAVAVGAIRFWETEGIRVSHTL